MGAVWLAAILPMVGATTITIWKDVPYTLALLWAFTELLLMARDRATFWAGWWGPLRLGTTLGLLMVYRHNGWITVVLVTMALAIGFFRSWRGLVRSLAALVAVGFVLPAVLVATFPVDTTTIEMAEVFTSDVAAVYQHHPESFSEPDVVLLEAVAPLEVWRDRYSCLDSTSLVFDAEFSNDAIRAEPDDYRALVMRRVLGDLPTVIGHRWCAASYLLVPAQPGDGFFHRPPFDIPPEHARHRAGSGVGSGLLGHQVAVRLGRAGRQALADVAPGARHLAGNHHLYRCRVPAAAVADSLGCGAHRGPDVERGRHQPGPRVPLRVRHLPAHVAERAAAVAGRPALGRDAGSVGRGRRGAARRARQAARLARVRGRRMARLPRRASERPSRVRAARPCRSR